MADSKIQWTDKTWNPVVGCEKVSPGCKFCYAKTTHDRRRKAFLSGKKMPAQYAEPFEVVQLKPERLLEPLKWREPKKVFVNSVSDLFHERVPFEFIDKVFAVMGMTPQHTYQILTKRPERMATYTYTRCFGGHPWVDAALDLKKGQLIPMRIIDNLMLAKLPNVALGVSVENQKEADKRIPFLQHTVSAVKFLSCEPLLEDIEFKSLRGIDWVIVGGESGPGARECREEWIRNIVRQNKAGATFVKQMGSNSTYKSVKQSYKQRQGGDLNEFPTDLRIREFPL